MKTSILNLALISVVVLGACKKNDKVDTTEQVKDRTYISKIIESPQAKAVLIEEVNGVRCNNCPLATEKAIEIQNDKSKDKVVVMNLFSGDYLVQFTSPWPSYPVLNSNSSSQIISTLGVPSGLPNGYIDRNKFGSQTVLFYHYTSWRDLVDERLNLSSPVNINMDKSISGRLMSLNLKLAYTSDVNEKHKFTIYLTESKIESKQTVVTSFDDKYIHNNVLRATLGSANGQALNASLVAGRNFERVMEFDVPVEYNIANLHIVCVVSNAETEEVIHVRQLDF